MSNCYNPCTSCGHCECTCSDTLGCLDIYDTSCINYNGLPLNCFGVTESDVNLNDLLVAAHAKVCTLIQNSGYVKVDASDQFPKPLADKLKAGANIILTGQGTGQNKTIRIDAVLNGENVDEKVKASSTDSVSGYLQDKLLVGDCMNIVKVGTGLDEKLRVVIDWSCAFSKISSLAGFCELVKTCTGGNQSQPCPSISLNSPAVNGDDVTLTWVSAASQFDIYVDGAKLQGMPVGGSSYTVNNLINGAHTIQVSALCSTGPAASATTSVIINTTCPTASGLSVTISAGSANLTWLAASGTSVLDQDVQYKLRSSATWLTSATLAAGATSHTINGLSSNAVYDFRILTNCSVGGPTPSSTQSNIQTTCPAVTLTPTTTSIGYSFAHVGSDVTQYKVELLNNTGTQVLQTKTENAPFASTITNSFNNLTQNTNYQVRVTVVAQEFNKGCSAQAISTNAPETCPTPTGLSGTVN